MSSIGETNLIVSHGTSLFNLVYSLSEGGKPATSFALNKFTPENRELGSSVLSKFGEIVITLNPEVLRDDGTRIFTRDAYTMDSPLREVHSIGLASSKKLSDRLEDYIKLTTRDVSKNLRDSSKTGEVMPFTSIVSKLVADDAYKLGFLNDQGITIEIPYQPDGAITELGAYLSASLGGDLMSVKDALGDLSAVRERLLQSYDNYYTELFENAEKRIHKIISRKRLDKGDDERFGLALDEINDWVNQVENSPVRVNKSALKEIIDEKIDEIGVAKLIDAAIKETESLSEFDLYTCYEEEFSSKEDAWEYIRDNSHAQSQQSLTFSQNEIFSIKAKELAFEQIHKHLGIIQPERFSGSVDDACSGLEEVINFKKNRAELQRSLSFKFGILEQTKSDFINSIVNGDIPSDEVVEKLSAYTYELDDSTIARIPSLVASVVEGRRTLTAVGVEQLDFEDAYQGIRDLKSDLDSLFKVMDLSFGEGRDFSKSLYSSLGGEYGVGRDFNADYAVELRSGFGKFDVSFDDLYSIGSTMEKLGERFNDLPDYSPYFEVVLGDVLRMEDPSVLSICAPEELRGDLEYLFEGNPALSSKLKFYDPKEATSILKVLETDMVKADYFENKPTLQKRLNASVG